MLRHLRYRLPSLAIRSIYIASVHPALEYAAVAWSGVRSGEVQRLERMQRSAARLIAGVSQSDGLPTTFYLLGLDWSHFIFVGKPLVLSSHIRCTPGISTFHRTWLLR